VKILHVIPKLPINAQRTIIGGAANALVNLSNQQRSTGAEVRVLSHFPLLGTENSDFMRENGYANIQIASMQNSRLYGAEFTLKAIGANLSYRKEFDIIHGHSGHIDYLLASRLIAGRRTDHLVYSLYCPLTLDSKITRYPLRKETIRMLCKDVTFIAISKNVSDSLEPVARKSRVHIIPPAVDIKRFSEKYDKAALRRKHGFDLQVPILLFVGNFSYAKNMECALLDFKQLLLKFPRARMIITTELQIARFAERERYLNNLIADLGIRESLVFPGLTNDIHELMQLSDVLIALFRDTDGPSDYYLAALEAMSTGTPAFVSPRGGMREVIDGSNGRFIDPEQPEILCRELEDLFANPVKAQEMGGKAARYLRANFSPSQVETRVRQVYLEVLQHAK
jgi:glycosyltransferase involved in cell wall biosynthesis